MMPENNVGVDNPVISTINPLLQGRIIGIRMLDETTLVIYARNEPVLRFNIEDAPLQPLTTSPTTGRLGNLPSYTWDPVTKTFMQNMEANVEKETRFLHDELISATPISAYEMLEISCDEQYYYVSIRDLQHGLYKTLYTFPGDESFGSVFRERTPIIDHVCIEGNTLGTILESTRDEAYSTRPIRRRAFDKVTITSNSGLYESIYFDTLERTSHYMDAQGEVLFESHTRETIKLKEDYFWVQISQQIAPDLFTQWNGNNKKGKVRKGRGKDDFFDNPGYIHGNYYAPTTLHLVENFSSTIHLHKDKPFVQFGEREDDFAYPEPMLVCPLLPKGLQGCVIYTSPDKSSVIINRAFMLLRELIDAKVITADDFDVLEKAQIHALENHEARKDLLNGIVHPTLTDIPNIDKFVRRAQNRCEIRKNAHVLFQESSNNSSRVAFFPAEILVKIAGFTGDPEVHDEKDSARFAHQHFGSPGL